MIKLVVIADDFTGSLDTGIKFAQTGAVTQMMIGPEFELSEINEDCQVLIVDSETRHMAPENAYTTVYHLVRRLADFGAERFYKKTDSALRGCVGAELAGLSDALGHRVHFVPSLPDENRITVNGIQYIGGIPVSKSVFGDDPFEPVRHDAVSDIIHEQNDISVINAKRRFDLPATGKRAVIVYDAQTEQDIDAVVKKLKDAGELRAIAGCAGFADRLSTVLKLEAKEKKAVQKAKGIFVVCGTVNRITGSQLSYAQAHGFRRISLDVEQKLKPGYLETQKGKVFLEHFKDLCGQEQPVILDVFDRSDVISEAETYCRLHGLDAENIRVTIAERLSELLEKWLAFGLEHTLVLSGGDTVYSFLKHIGCDQVYPLCEVEKGAILFKAKGKGRSLHIVSKSGGFGKEDFFVKMLEILTFQEVDE